MATDNRRVAAYFPPEVDEAFKEFKIKNGFATEENPSQNDSKALIHILSEFLKVEHPATYLVSLPDNLVTTEQLSELESKLLSELSKQVSRIDALEAGAQGDGMLATGELAKRLGISGSTLSHWKSTGKKGKTPDQLLKVTREKDPDGIGWILVESANKFKPEKPLPSSLPGVSQGNLLG